MGANNHTPVGALPSIEKRVARSLQRLGYDKIEVTDLGDGQIKLSGNSKSEDDRAIMIATARAVAGVKFVVNKVT